MPTQRQSANVACYATQNFMLIKIDRQEAIDEFPNLPLRHYDQKADDYVFNYPKVFANYVLTLPSNSNKGHIKLLGTELVSLANHLGYDNFIFLGDENIAWLRRLNTHKIFQNSLQYLIDNKIKKRFNGALQVYIAEIPTFVKHLSLLVQTNGILPYVHFIGSDQIFIGSICQYGNLHISTKNKVADKKFKDVIAKTSFSFLADKNC